MNGTAFCAEEYDDKIKRTLPFYEQFYEQIADILEVSGKKDVSWLDIGCGTGKVYETVRRRVPVKEFTFTDISEKMLDIARSRFLAEGNRFKQMSVLELEDKEKYDVITAIQVYHYLSEKDRKSAEMKCWQALRADGIFFTFENIAPNSGIGKQIILDRWKTYQMKNGASEKDADIHIKRYGTGYFPITVEAHLELMRSCGFQAVELIWMSCMQAGFMGVK